MPIRAVVFDLFGTLIDDSPPAGVRGRSSPRRPTALGADPERFGSSSGSAHDVARYTGPIEDCFEAICAELGVADRAASPRRSPSALEQLRRLLVPRPDADATLEALRGRGLGLGMISNASSELSALWAETRVRGRSSTRCSSRRTSG